MLTLAGIVGSGKSSLTKILSEELGTKAFYEPVDDNPVLPLFYEGNKLVEEGKQETNPYTMLLQVFFLNRRFSAIKEAMADDNNVLDRSIYEDKIFMKMNVDQGHATQVEWQIYKSLLDNMMQELPYAAHKKAPDLMIMIDVSYETMIKRVKKRGREFEQVEVDPSLESYYKDLLQRYEKWKHEYNASDLLVIDGDKYDFMENPADRRVVLLQIYDRLLKIGSINEAEYKGLVSNFANLSLEES